MKVLKHMEAVFVLALAAAAGAGIAVEGTAPSAVRLPVLAVNTSMPADVAVVQVTAKRMSAAEKRASLAAERAAFRASGRNFGRA